MAMVKGAEDIVPHCRMYSAVSNEAGGLFDMRSSNFDEPYCRRLETVAVRLVITMRGIMYDIKWLEDAWVCTGASV